MLLLDDLVEEIKVDLGYDINSLGISDDSIALKIHEALRKISTYAPYVAVEMFKVEGSSAQLPEDSTTVLEVLNLNNPSATNTRVIADDTDLFSVSRYLYNYNDLMDPYIFLMQKNAVSTLQSFVKLTDYRFEKSTHKLYLSNNNKGIQEVCVRYLRRYRSVEEIEDDDILQTVKEYALALCKIIEGNIRRKLQSAPGAIQLDGDSLVSEGMSEKQLIEDKLVRRFQNLRFGIRV